MVQQRFTNLLKGDYSQLYLLIQVKRTNEKKRERERGRERVREKVDRGMREKQKGSREGKEIKKKNGKDGFGAVQMAMRQRGSYFS